ncbi:hypothetical protein FQN54_001618 [Arachnomyces sp. PD_36]|nr:hypothetical protein FQN54_001618 [Arachnomyces sp. PD_36]
MRVAILIQALCTVLPRLALAYDDPLVSLDYGVFQGNYDSTYNISHFRKIPFAAPAIGENRFRAPQPPVPITDGVYDSDQDFDMCPQRTVNGSEDCHYLGLYSRPWVDPEAKRPVLVVFYGGAFIQGSASFTIPPPGYPVLNVTDLNDYVVVYPNYRINAFGFLPGKAVRESPTSDLNPGLLDQQYALQWVQKYIHKFGGDPKNVTIWGQSAGGGSVVAQVIANGGRTKPRLFNRALASSPFWPKTYEYDSPEAEDIYSQLVNLTGCGDSSDTDSLACLKSVDVQTIRDASLVISESHQWTSSSYTWAPVIDGDFLRGPLSHVTSQDNADQVFSMYNTQEGKNFIPPGLAAEEADEGYIEFDDWLGGILPELSARQIETVKNYYSPIDSSEMIPSYNTSFDRAQLIYRDVVLACPAYWLSMSAKGAGYLGEYSISPAEHASDTIYWNEVDDIQKSDSLIYKGFAGAFGSFFQTGDPNAHKLTDDSQPGVPELGSGGEQREFVITAEGFENIELKQLRERCDFWRRVGGDIPI